MPNLSEKIKKTFKSGVPAGLEMSVVGKILNYLNLPRQKLKEDYESDARNQQINEIKLEIKSIKKERESDYKRMKELDQRIEYLEQKDE